MAIRLSSARVKWISTFVLPCPDACGWNCGGKHDVAKLRLWLAILVALSLYNLRAMHCGVCVPDDDERLRTNFEHANESCKVMLSESCVTSNAYQRKLDHTAAPSVPFENNDALNAAFCRSDTVLIGLMSNHPSASSLYVAVQICCVSEANISVRLA